MTLTLAQARDVVEDHLDDATNARWSTAQVDVALGYALSMCLNDYAAAGGDRLDVLVSKTSSTAGVISLTSENPLVIRGVSLLYGSRYYPLTALRTEERNIPDTVARTLQVRYIPTYVISATTSHPLVGVGATAANSWDAFDHWVCARAALFCSVKDAEAREELIGLEQEMRRNAIELSKIPQATPFPSQQTSISRWISYTKDTWTSATKQLLLVQR